jgi:hypothetical protein
MTMFSKKTILLAGAVTAVIASSILPAIAAGVIAPPPPPREGQRPGCYTPNQAAARMIINMSDAGYIETPSPQVYNNGTMVRGYGVKANNKWFAFKVDLCKGNIVEQKALAKKPTLLGG